MRVQIAGPVDVREGQPVRVCAKLRKGCEYGFVAVFSAIGDVEPSPHVPIYKSALLREGRPDFVVPTTMRLTKQARPSMDVVVTADEDCTMYLFQEVDTAADTLAIGRIIPHATGLQAILAHARRWLHGNTPW